MESTYLLLWVLAATTSLRCMASPVIVLLAIHQGHFKAALFGPLARPYYNYLNNDAVLVLAVLLLILEMLADKAEVELPTVDMVVLACRPLCAMAPPLMLLHISDPASLLLYSAGIAFSALQPMSWFMRALGCYSAFGWELLVLRAVSVGRDIIAFFSAFVTLAQPVVGLVSVIGLTAVLAPLASMTERHLRAQAEARRLSAIVEERERAL